MDGFQKDGGNFFNFLQKEGGTQKGGVGVAFPQKRGGVPTLEETMGLGPVSKPHFVYDFSRKMVLMLHSIT